MVPDDMATRRPWFVVEIIARYDPTASVRLVLGEQLGYAWLYSHRLLL